MREIEWGEVLVFSPYRWEKVPAGATWIESPNWSHSEFCAWVWQDLVHHVIKPFCFKIEWDGFVCDSSQWTDEFLKYDFVGAPWWYDDGLNVGCGAALKSRRFMQFLSDRRDEYPVKYPDDGVLGREYRPRLEREGFVWAPEPLASRFGLECTRPAADSKHFMFHDSFNFPNVLSGERLEERLRLVYANPYLRSGDKIRHLECGRRPLILERLAG